MHYKTFDSKIFPKYSHNTEEAERVAASPPRGGPGTPRTTAAAEHEHDAAAASGSSGAGAGDGGAGGDGSAPCMGAPRRQVEEMRGVVVPTRGAGVRAAPSGVRDEPSIRKVGVI